MLTKCDKTVIFFISKEITAKKYCFTVFFILKNISIIVCVRGWERERKEQEEIYTEGFFFPKTKTNKRKISIIIHESDLSSAYGHRFTTQPHNLNNLRAINKQTMGPVDNEPWACYCLWWHHHKFSAEIFFIYHLFNKETDISFF